MSATPATQSPLQYLDEALAQLTRDGLHRTLRQLQGEQLAVARFDGREVVNLSSNNYLGLTTHPRMREAALAAVKSLGVGSGSVRTIAGTMELHMELERRIAVFKKTEASVVFQSGFAANAGTVSALLGKGDLILSDELNHASIIDGARLSRADIRVFPHRDVAGLGRLLEETREVKRRLVITDGVFSMDGDIAPLPELAALAREHGAIMMIDDAHASGVLGRAGRGTVDHFDVHGQVDIQVGTLSKAIGVLGGYVCGSKSLIDYLYHRARPFLFSTSHPPAVAAACLTAFDVLEQEPERIQRLWSNTKRFKEGLARLGFDTGRSETPITPIMVGEADLAMRFSDRLFERGVFAQGIGYPTVAKGKARLRTIVTATHTEQDLDRALSILGDTGRELGVLR
ncbi:MAG TPA: glycine C-acetyltransferase [Candidatus Polarisedimenticolia bacterium]|nr:glycine C-acetyltransferase [Candidatus Polarisedimenticolia bacterium]